MKELGKEDSLGRKDSEEKGRGNQGIRKKKKVGGKLSGTGSSLGRIKEVIKSQRTLGSEGGWEGDAIRWRVKRPPKGKKSH